MPSAKVPNSEYLPPRVKPRQELRAANDNPRPIRRTIFITFLLSFFAVLNIYYSSLDPTSGQKKSHRFEAVPFVPYEYEFPSADERFEYYMGDWYNKTDWELTDCSLLVEGQANRSSGKFFDHDLIFPLQTLKACSNINMTKDQSVLNYCTDAYDTLRRFDAGSNDDDHELPAAIFHFGDSISVQPLPAISKARGALHETGPDTQPLKRPIIWPLNIPRHYGGVERYHAKYAGNEVPWEEKMPALVWRGKPTGLTRLKFLSRWIHYDPNVVDVAFNGIAPNVKGFQRPFSEKHLIRDERSIANMTHYKYLLNVEGNDVATGLKWMLYSNSVVLMSPPTKASWAMEDLLLPFVHYIPLSSDMSNILEMIEWAEEHQEACQQISARATEFMKRLWISEKARAENAYLKEKLAITYVKQFQNQLSKCNQEGSEGNGYEPGKPDPATAAKDESAKDRQTANLPKSQRRGKQRGAQRTIARTTSS